MAAPFDEQRCLAHAQSFAAALTSRSPIYTFLLPRLRVTAASPGSNARVVALLELEAAHMNSKGSLHGSVTATIVDFMGGLAIAAADGRTAGTGVSVDIHVSYAGGAVVGDVVEIEGRLDKLGASLAFTTVTLRRVERVDSSGRSGALVARASHTKYVKQRETKEPTASV